MNTQLIIIAIIILGVIGALSFIFPCLKKKGINTTEVLDKAEKGLNEAGTVLELGKELVPSKALDTLAIIDNLALRATKSARQLSISSQLPLEQRQSQAKESILAGLATFNIPISDNLEKIIDDSIQSFVLDSKTDEEIEIQQAQATQNQTISLQQQLADIQATNARLVQANQELTQKLNTVQSTVAPIVATQ